MAFPTIIIQGPSAMVFLSVFMTTLMLILKLDGRGVFPFRGDSLLILAPIHFIFLKMAMYIVNSGNKDAVRMQRDTLDLLEDDDLDTEEDETMTDDEASTVNRVNLALFNNAMLLWPTFITINMKLLVDPHNENLSWGWGLVAFLLFCFYFFMKGLEMGIIWWSDARRIVLGNDA